MKKIFSPFLNPYTGPILAITIILAFLLFFILPNFSKENKISYMEKKAVAIIDNLKSIRSYYTQSIISKVREDGHIQINYDHQDKDSTIPLPATLVHDLSKIIPEKNMEIKMFSNYPFPNRKDRVLDESEKASLAYLINNPNEVYSRTVIKDSQQVFKVTVADIFYDQSCVSCHNTRADTPKNDWKLGDVRGVIEISMPYKQEFILTSQQQLTLLSVLVFLILILAVHYTVVSIGRQKEHLEAKETLEKEVEERTQSLLNTNKLLNQYKKAVDFSAIISKTDKNGVITYVNEEFVKISQYSQEELIGKKHNIVRHPDMPNSLFDDLWQTITDKKIWKGTIKNKAKDGSSYYVASTIVPILNYQDEIEEFLAIRLDITKVIKSQIQAQKANTAKSTFLANISHEIRTPLNAIIGFSDILSKSKTLDNQSVKQANVIQTSATTLLTIINDILDVSKIQSGNFEISIEQTDIYYICEHVVELFSKRAIEKHIKLVLDLDNKLPVCLLTDGVRVRQVLSNLISNAIKFTPEHGVVEININMLENDDKKALVRFEVNDTGIGIPSEKLEKIFQPFMQVDHKSNREFEGTGLGLSICTHIVESLGSKIEVFSSVGSGTKFYFDLELDICNEAMHTNKDYINHLNFTVTNEESDLYHYAKRYLNIFGTINNNENSESDILVHSCLKKSKDKIKELRERYPNQPKLILFDYEEDIKRFNFKENEQALALPFYASKVNDALQELKKKSTQNTIEIEEEIDSFEGKILIAEDNMANQELISYILNSMDIDFDIKNNGLEAVEAYKNNSYDLILMDINMPVLDGINAFKQIRAYESENALAQTAIIALTANAVKGDKERFLNLGMDDYLSKPINTDELKDKFNKYLDKKHKKIEEKKEEIQIIETSKEELDLEKIASTIGVSVNIAEMIANKFKKSILSDIEELGTYIDENNNEQITAKAHYIKNSCLNVALNDICDMLQQIESKPENENTKELFELTKKSIEKIL